MRIGIVGTGRMATGLGSGWAATGHRVTFGSREPARARTLAAAIGNGADGGTIEESARYADVLLLAVPWHGVPDVVRTARPRRGGILVDCTNPFTFDAVPVGLAADGSAAERIATLARGVRVIKAFNHVYAEIVRHSPRFGSHNATVFYCGDELDAKETVAGLAEELGFDPVDAGPLWMARYLEPLGGLMLQLAHAQGYGTDQALKQIRR